LKHDNEEEKSMPNCRRSDDGDDDENFLQVAVNIGRISVALLLASKISIGLLVGVWYVWTM
jgi:hypothetical protein